MNMVQVYIKGQEDKELSSFCAIIRYVSRTSVWMLSSTARLSMISRMVETMQMWRSAWQKCLSRSLVARFAALSSLAFLQAVRSVTRHATRTSLNLSAGFRSNQRLFPCQGCWRTNRSSWHKGQKEERAKRLKEKNNIEVDANFFKNKIVCIWDDVVTTGTSFCAYTAQLEQVGAHVTNGIFLGKTSYKYVQQ